LQAHRALSFLRLVHGDGRRRLLLFVEWTKFESLKGVRKAGYAPIGWIDVRRHGAMPTWQITLTDPEWSGIVPPGVRAKRRGRARERET